MADRQVTSAELDGEGRVQSISGPWGTRTKAAALVDILHEQHRYFVVTDAGERDLLIARGPEGRQLRTEADPDLPDDLQRLGRAGS